MHVNSFVQFPVVTVSVTLYEERDQQDARDGNTGVYTISIAVLNLVKSVESLACYPRSWVPLSAKDLHTSVISVYPSLSVLRNANAYKAVIEAAAHAAWVLILVTTQKDMMKPLRAFVHSAKLS